MVSKGIGELTLRQKIGQMLMCGFHGTELSEDIERLIREEHLGGIIYFRRNLTEPAQVAKLSASLQQLALANGGVPLLIAIDQEGGMVMRIDQGVTPIPGSMALGATGDAGAAYEAAKVTGSELKAMGINMNFAPCLDINNNPLNPVIGVRSYGGDAETVGRLGTAAVQGYQEAGIAATVKHFPGHGDTGEDSHTALPVVPHPRERLDRLELAPFRRAAKLGVDAVMTAHVLFPAVEPERLPATLSPRVIDGLLRQELGYDGVVVTDCLEMNAIAEHYGIAEGAVMAVEAGADLVLVSHRIERQQTALDALVQAVESGRICEERIDRSVERLLALKRRVAPAAASAALAPGASLATEASQRLAEHIAKRSVTLLRGEAELPLDPAKPVLVIWPEVQVGTEVDEVLARRETAGYWLAQLNYQVREERIGVQPSAAEQARVVELARDAEQIVLVTYNASFSPGQVELAKALAALPKAKLAVAAARNPFDISVLPDGVQIYLACYENTPFAMKALARVLAGELAAQGKLPAPLVASEG